MAFPLEINMLPYTTQPWSRDKSDYDYDLLSVVVHIGDIDSGHYLAYCRQGDQVHTIPSIHPSIHPVNELLWVLANYALVVQVQRR